MSSRKTQTTWKGQPRILTREMVIDIIGECQHENPKKHGQYPCKNCYQNASARMPDRIEKHRASKRKGTKTYRAKHPVKVKAMLRRCFLKSQYGITIEEYDSIFAAQEYKCAICLKELTVEKANIDHNHATGAIRAILCTNCNTGIGSFKDNPELLRRAATYLEQHSTKNAAYG